MWVEVQKAHLHGLQGEWCTPRPSRWGTVLWGGWGGWCGRAGVATGVVGLSHRSPAWPPAPSSRWTQKDFSCKALFLSGKGSACKEGGSKDLSSSRWIATHLVNQLIKCNEYPALGKPTERPHSPLCCGFPTSSSFNLDVQCFLFFIFFDILFTETNLTVILSSSAVGSILRNNNQVQIKKQRHVYFWSLFYKPVCNGQRKNTINKEAGSGSSVLLSEYLFWQWSGVLWNTGLIVSRVCQL